MNKLASEMALEGAPILHDMVRDIPRRVVGFSTIIETGMDDEGLEASLTAMAATSAFRLDTLTVERDAVGGASRLLRAEFTLTAARGTCGDPQIFSLLREVAARHRWNGVDKHLSR